MGKRVQNFNLKNLETKVINLGYVGENVHTQIVIECSEVLWDYPNAVASMVVQPPRGDLYPVEVTREENNIIWEITASDVVYAGSGRVQLTFTNDGEIVKSAVGTTRISGSIEATGEAPEPLQNWIDQAEETAYQIALTAKDEVIEQIQDAAEEARESIPADYTQLSDDVTSLKSAINGYSEYNAHNIVFPVTNHTSEYNTVFTKTGVNTVYVDTSNLNPNNRNPDYYYVYLDSTDMPVEPGKSYSLTVNTTDNSNLTLQIWVKDSSDNRTILYSGGSTSNYKITIPSNAYSFTLRYLAHKAVGTGTIGFTLFDEAELSPKRAETQKLIFDGLGIIDADFVVGVATNTGTINTSPKYANTTKQIVSIPFDVNLRPENGYCFFLQLFNPDGTFNSTTSWITSGYYHLTANQKFMLTVALSPLSTSYVSSENEFKTFVRFERENRQWIGKNWYAFGTSISDTTFPMPYDLPGYTGKYPPYLAQLSGLIHTNYAMGGSRITNAATADRTTILQKILATDLSDADIITIDGFVNDFGACEIGDLESLTPETADDTTLYGAMFLAITHCLENSNAVVCLLTDNTGKLWTTPGGTVHPVDLRPWKKDGHGKTQDDYCDAMRKIATYLGCYCIDAGSMSSINYCHPEYIQDTIHQSIAGGKQYANAIWSVLKNIQPNVPRT